MPTLFHRPIRKSTALVYFVFSSLLFGYLGTLYPTLELRYDIHENGHITAYADDGIEARRADINQVVTPRWSYNGLAGGYRAEADVIWWMFVLTAFLVFMVALMTDSFAFFPILWMYVGAIFRLMDVAIYSSDVAKMAAMRMKTRTEVVADIFGTTHIFILAVTILFTVLSLKFFFDYVTIRWPDEFGRMPLIPGIRLRSSKSKENNCR